MTSSFMIGVAGAKSIRGTMSCWPTTWQKLPHHRSWRIAWENDSFPSIGEPNVIHNTWMEGEFVCIVERSQRAERDARAPPSE